MNDTCATHRSRVPQRSFGRNKRRSDDSGRRERTRPGLWFVFCVRQSSVRGCRFSVMFVYLIIKVSECSPIPASFFPYLRTVLHWCRNPGGRRDTLSESPRCWGGSRCWGDRAAGRSGDRQWLPEAVVLEQWKSRWDGRLAAVLLGRGGVAAVREGAEESAPWSPSAARALLIFLIFFYQINKHNRKAAAPHGWLPHTKHKPKSRPGPLSPSTVVTPPFIPSEAPPWDSRPVSGAGVVHYHLLHRPRSVPTALGPAPLVTMFLN